MEFEAPSVWRIASKHTVTFHNLAALGLKRLAAILFDLAEVDPETPTGTRRRLGPRPEGSGSKHDSDVYGGQQYAPLLGLEVAG